MEARVSNPPVPSSGPPLLLLVDGHAHAYRAFHAIRNLSSPSGEPTNAIFGFVKAMERLQAQHAPSHVGVVWDGGLAEARVAALASYKANRPSMPEPLEQQLDGLVDWVRAKGWRSLCAEGVEADDWIAGLARSAAADGMPVLIATSDKDFMQLVDDRIRLLNPAGGEGRAVGRAEVLEKTGVEPAQIVDWLSLIGDSVDNIPGVPGVGPKTATALLQQFGSCEGLFEKLDEVGSLRIRQALRSAWESVTRNQALIRLKEDAGEPRALADLQIQAPDNQALASLYRRWGFRSLLAGLEPERPRQGEFF